MKFTVEQPVFAAACAMAARAARSRFVPILKCVNISAADGSLRITGADLDMAITATCAASVSRPGAVSVAAESLSRWVGCAVGLIYGEANGDTLSLRCGRAEYALAINRDEFPAALENLDGGAEVVGGIEALRLCRAFAADESDAKPYLMGVLFDGASAWASNGHRLFAMPAPGGVGNVPTFGIQAATSIKGAARLFVGKNAWRVEAEGIHVGGKSIEQKAIDWRNVCGTVLPAGVVDADSLSAAVTMASSGGASWVVMDARDGLITVSGERFSDSGATSSSTASVQFDGPNFTTVLARKIIETALGPMEGHVVNVGFSLQNGALVLRAGELLSVAFPLRDHRAVMPETEVAA